MAARRRDQLHHVRRSHVATERSRALRAADEPADGDLHRRHLVRRHAALEPLDERPVLRVEVDGHAEEPVEGGARVRVLERRLGGGGQLADALQHDRRQQRILRREPAEDGAVADAGAPGDLVDAHVDALLGEALGRRLEHAVEVALRVGAEFPLQRRQSRRLRYLAGSVEPTPVS